MIWPIFCYALIIAILIAGAFSVALLWVKIVCWVIVAVLTLFVIFAIWISQTYGQIGHGGG